MSQRGKLIQRFRSRPKDFTWSELQTLLAGFGYKEEPGAGSRTHFVHGKSGVIISLHRPHPRKELKAYQIRDLLEHLKQEGHL